MGILVIFFLSPQSTGLFTNIVWVYKHCLQLPGAGVISLDNYVTPGFSTAVTDTHFFLKKNIIPSHPQQGAYTSGLGLLLCDLP